MLERAHGGSRYYVPQLSGLYSAIEPLAYPLMRLVIGLFLVPHGAQKLFGVLGGDQAQTAAMFAKMGFNPGYFWMMVTGGVEFFGGLLIAIGFLTRPAALACAILLAVACTVHLPMGWFWTGRGAEFPVMWTILAFAVFMRGGGLYSVDNARGREF